MRVAFYTNTILEHSGGLEKYFIDVATSLSERYDDMDIDIVTNDDRFAERLQTLLSIYYIRKLEKQSVHKEESSAIVHRLGNKVKYIKASNMRQLKTILQGYNVIYSKNELVEALTLKLLGIRCLPPVIFGCHTAVHYPNPRTLHAKIHNFIYMGVMYDFLTKNVSAFHVINKSDYQRFFTRFQNITFIPNPLDSEKFRTLAEGNKDIASKSLSNGFNVIWAGRLTEQKGIDELVAIINRCGEEEWANNIVWNIFGDGDRRDDIEELSKRNSNVRYFGHVDEAILAGFMAQCNVLVSTSLWESFGYSVLQGVSLGLPVISFDISGPDEIIVNAENGFLVKSRDSFMNRLQFLVSGGSVGNPGSGLGEFAPDCVYPRLRKLLTEVASEVK